MNRNDIPEHHGIAGQKECSKAEMVDCSKKTYDDILMHHGILGQKWGVRRFQNADGTYTSAGKQRYRQKSADSYILSARINEAVKRLGSSGAQIAGNVESFVKDNWEYLAVAAPIVSAGVISFTAHHNERKTQRGIAKRAKDRKKRDEKRKEIQRRAYV
jgi:hypothetical protein